MAKFSNGGIALALLGLLASAGAAAAGDSDYQFIDGYLVNHDDLSTSERGISGGARVGVGMPFGQGGFSGSALELGLFGNGSKRLPTADSAQFGVAVDVVQSFDLGGFKPFVLAGLAVVNEEDNQSANSFYPALEAGLGARIGDFRASITAQDVFNDDLTPTQDSFIDYRFNVGFFIGAAERAPAPAPARPVDSDGDGVADTDDRCPAQAAPTADGCPAPLAPAEPPRDTDADGIDDSKDECPGTLSSLKVDASGCVAAGAAQSIVLKGVNFLPGSADLTADAKKVLDETSASLTGQTGLKVEVGGHTDASGADAVNMALSQRRAESVRKYLIGKGIAADRLVAKGYGETQPIADNKTAAGRSTNRRVELKILD